MTEHEIDRARKRLELDGERERGLREAQDKCRAICFEADQEWRKTALKINEWYNAEISKF